MIIKAGGALYSIIAALGILPAEAHPMDLRVGLPEPWRNDATQ
jgi:hypothetical protein